MKFQDNLLNNLHYRFIGLAMFIIVFVIGISGCKKEVKPDLPPATQTGENTFGCYLNGEPCTITHYWIRSFFGDNGVEFENLTKENNQMIIHARTNNLKYEFQFSFFVEWKKEMGIHYVNVDKPPYCCWIDLGNGMNFNENCYRADSSNLSEITITNIRSGPGGNYSIGSILSGTFDIKMENINGKTMHLSDGRFDLKME